MSNITQDIYIKVNMKDTTRTWNETCWSVITNKQIIEVNVVIIPFDPYGVGLTKSLIVKKLKILEDTKIIE